MKPIFVSRYVSTGETVATGVTGVHEYPLRSATMNSVVQCGIFHVIEDLNTYFFASTKRVSYRKRRALSTRARQLMNTSNTPFVRLKRNCSRNMVQHPIQLELPLICYETSFTGESFSAADT
jgi:hypothetical protein